MGRKFTGVQAISKTSVEIAFTYRGVRCRERIKLKPTPANLKRAERHRAAILDAIERGTFDYAITFPDSPRAAQFSEHRGASITFKDYLDQWLKSSKAHVKASTWNDYRKTVNNHLIPAFGELRLTDLKRAHIKQWASGLDVTNKRIANLLSPLRVSLQEAVDDALIETNPLFGWSYRRKEAPKSQDDVDPFTTEEQAAILDQLEGQGRNLIQFAFWSGLRTSELVALEWGDIDRRRGVVCIRRGHTQAAATCYVARPQAQFVARSLA
jgi:integrase